VLRIGGNPVLASGDRQISPEYWPPVRTRGGELRDLLLLLADHGAKHLSNCLEWLCDVSRLLLNGAPWDYFASHCLRSLGLARHSSAELMQAPVLKCSPPTTTRFEPCVLKCSRPVDSGRLPRVLHQIGFA
jgi:hypothetical protein